MRLVFDSEQWNFNVDSKTAKNISRKIDHFFNNLISIANGKFSILLRIYPKLPVNVLTSSLKI